MAASQAMSSPVAAYRSNAFLTSPGLTTSSTAADLSFSPGLFEPASISPNLLSPFGANSGLLLKKRHHMSPPPSLESAFLDAAKSATYNVRPFAIPHPHPQSHSITKHNHHHDEEAYNNNAAGTDLYPGTGSRRRRTQDKHHDDAFDNDAETASRTMSVEKQVAQRRVPPASASSSSSSKLARRGSPIYQSPQLPPTRKTVTPADGVPAKCNCRKSRCLKLYCECFSALRYCDSCNCQDCYNNTDHEAARQESIKQTKVRNTSAFQSKTPGSSSGCNCKNSLCLKKYCECFQANVFCSGTNCKCSSCQNFEGSTALEDLKSSSDNKRRKGSSPSSVVCISENGTPQEGSPHFTSLSALKATTSSFSVQDGLKPRQGLRSSRRSATNSSSSSGDADKQTKSVKFSPAIPVNYPFFGEDLPQLSKVIALQCLDFLDNKDLYAMSVVSSTLASAATDEALWERV